jgi:multidrug resistance efflux pump
MDNAETKFTNDSLLYIRRTRLWQQGIGAQNDVDNAYASYITSMNQKKSAEEKYHSTKNDLEVAMANARSQLSGAKNDLSNYFIKSPENGRVYLTLKEQGEAVKLNDAVAMLGKSSQRLIRLSVDQQDIDKVKTGQEVLLRTDITGNTIYHARVERIYPMMNESDQTFRVDAYFTDGTRLPYTHSSVEANIIIQKKTNALTIPRLAMISEDSVIVSKSGHSKTIAIGTGIRTLDEVEITGGLDESAEIIMPQ